EQTGGEDIAAKTVNVAHPQREETVCAPGLFLDRKQIVISETVAQFSGIRARCRCRRWCHAYQGRGQPRVDADGRTLLHSTLSKVRFREAIHHPIVFCISKASVAMTSSEIHIGRYN